MKKLKKIVILVFAALCLSLSLSGCDAKLFVSAENLVRPPKLTGQDGELQLAFEKAVSEKGEYILRYPSDGQYRSAYIRYDCDGDGDDEAFVFYSLKTEEMSVYMYMLDYNGGEWNAVGEILGDGSDIFSVEFCDLNNDNIAEVLVGWSSIDSKSNKNLSVYCSDKNSQSLNYKVLAIETYTNMYTDDIDMDGEEEILLTFINSTSDTYTTEARLLKMSDNEKGDLAIKTIGQVGLYSEITGFTSITSGRHSGIEYIYLDESAGDTYLTEMLYWDSEKNILAAPIKVDVLSIASCPTSRSLPLTCADINNDGEIEIPVTQLLQNSFITSIAEKTNTEGENETVTGNLYVTKWCKYDEEEFTIVRQYIENSTDLFRFLYDADMMSDWNINIDTVNHTTEFGRAVKSEDPSKPDKNQVMFTITAVDVTDAVSIGSYLTSGKTYKYIYEITDAGTESGITNKFISEHFSLTENADNGSMSNEKNTNS